MVDCGMRAVTTYWYTKEGLNNKNWRNLKHENYDTTDLKMAKTAYKHIQLMLKTRRTGELTKSNDYPTHWMTLWRIYPD